MATGFAGGIGGTELENCGVFSAGVMIISALYGRTSAEVNDQFCQTLIKKLRVRFLEQFGTLTCGELRASGYGAQTENPCSMLVERAARILVELLHQAQEDPSAAKKL